jgi:large subunit ribosomal protein L2
MAIKTYKPYTPARRGMTVSAFDGVDKKAKPERSLLETLKKNSGRNSYGRITVRHRGGGNKRKYRVIDFRRDKLDMPAVVQRLEYDPNRSAFIALVKYEDGELRYVLAPVGLKAGDTILASAAADIKPGNCLPLATSPSAPSSTTSSCSPATALSLSAPPASLHSCWRRKASSLRFACPPVRSATSA